MSDPTTRYREMLRDLMRGALAAGVVGLFVNVLHLGLPLFTIQVYDRVLSSGSSETLAALVVLAVTILGFQTLLEVLRQRILVILANRAMIRLGRPVFEAAVETSLTKGPQAASTRAAGRLRTSGLPGRRRRLPAARPGVLADLPGRAVRAEPGLRPRRGRAARWRWPSPRWRRNSLCAGRRARAARRAPR